MALIRTAMMNRSRRQPVAAFSVTVDVIAPELAGAVPTWHDVSAPDGAAVRAVPLLAIMNAGTERLIVVGDLRIMVHHDLRTKLTAVVRGLWVTAAGESPAGPTATNWRIEPNDDRLAELLSNVIKAVPYSGRPDPEGLATEIAKAQAEQSRDRIREIKVFRYGLERKHSGGARRSIVWWHSVMAGWLLAAG